MRTDRQTGGKTGMTKLIIAFRNFSGVSTKEDNTAKSSKLL